MSMYKNYRKYEVTFLAAKEGHVAELTTFDSFGYSPEEAAMAAANKAGLKGIRVFNTPTSVVLADDLKIPEGLSPLGQRCAQALVTFLQNYGACVWTAPSDGTDACVSCGGPKQSHDEFDGLTYTGGCRAFYTPKEWRKRGERHGIDAELIIVHDGGDLYEVFTDDHKLTARAIAVIEEAGGHVESCTNWYTAVYATV